AEAHPPGAVTLAVGPRAFRPASGIHGTDRRTPGRRLRTLTLRGRRLTRPLGGGRGRVYIRTASPAPRALPETLMVGYLVLGVALAIGLALIFRGLRGATAGQAMRWLWQSI